MNYETILVDTEDGVGIITLNRPDKLNAMNRRLVSELQAASQAMVADPTIGCIVVTGAGERAFSAGGDIQEQIDDDRRYSDEEQARCRKVARATISELVPSRRSA